MHDEEIIEITYKQPNLLKKQIDEWNRSYLKTIIIKGFNRELLEKRGIEERWVNTFDY